MQFTNLKLSEPLQQAISQMGYQEATPIQAQAIPPALEGRDVIGCAQTGTGKTAAYLLPALEYLLQKSEPARGPRLVVLAPTRALVIEVTEQARKMAAHTSLRILDVYGGAAMRKQIDRLRRGVDVVIATPGRLMDHMRRRNVDLRAVEVLVLDEADRMLDMGFLPDIRQIVSWMPEQRQTMLFSATMPLSILNLTQQFQQEPVKIEIGVAQPPTAIKQALYPVPKH